MAGSPAVAPEAAPEAREDVVISRLFDAPRALVWEAWSSYAHLARWWGPMGFTTPRGSVELRPGGRFSLVTRSPDGTEYPMEGSVLEVEAPSRLVWTALAHGDVRVDTVVTFEDEGGKTRLTVRQTVPRDPMMARGQKPGWSQSLERLATALVESNAAGASSSPTADREIATSRVFDAPRGLVWKAWTEPGRLAGWWGPKGFAWAGGMMDLRPGGIFHYGLRTPDGKATTWGRFVYREVVEPSRLVFVVSFSDVNGGVARHPAAADWPLEVLNVLTLEESGGKTALVLEGRPLHASEAERRAFEGGIGSMQQGFKETLDQLTAYLATERGGAA